MAAALLAISISAISVSSARAPDSNSIAGFVPSRVAEEQRLEAKFRSIPDPAHAESDLRHLTSEPHPAGSEASYRVAKWLRDQFRSFGFDAEVVSYSAWLPQAREISLELTKPEAKRLGSPEQPYDDDKATHDKRALPGINDLFAIRRRHRASDLCELRHAG